MTFLGRYNNQGRILRTFTWIIFFTFSLSANAYALPIQFDISRVINLSIMDGRGGRSGEHLNSLPSNGSGSHLLYGLPDLPAGGSPQGGFIPLSTLPSIISSMPFVSGLPGLDGEAPIFELLEENTGDTADIRGWEWYTGFDAEAMADFLAGVDFLTTDWQADLGQSPVATHETPAPPATEVIRRNPRECLQGNHGPKREVQESLCTEGSGGFAGSGVGSPGGRSSGSSAAFLAGTGGASGNSRNVIGVGDGIGGGGAGGGGGGAGGSNNSAGNGSAGDNGGGTGNNGTGNEGGDKGDGSPGSSSGTDNGGGIGQGGGAGAAENGDGTWDQGGNGGSGGGGAAEVRPVPEPVSLALVALGFAGMYIIRSRRRTPSETPGV